LETVKDEVASLETTVDSTTVSSIEQGMQNHLNAVAEVKVKIETNPDVPEDTKARLRANFEALEGSAKELEIKIENKKVWSSSLNALLGELNKN